MSKYDLSDAQRSEHAAALRVKFAAIHPGGFSVGDALVASPNTSQPETWSISESSGSEIAVWVSRGFGRDCRRFELRRRQRTHRRGGQTAVPKAVPHNDGWRGAGNDFSTLLGEMVASRSQFMEGKVVEPSPMVYRPRERTRLPLVTSVRSSNPSWPTVDLFHGCRIGLGSVRRRRHGCSCCRGHGVHSPCCVAFGSRKAPFCSETT